MKLLIRWLISACSLLIVAHFVSGFHVNGFRAALLAAVIVGFVNSTLGLLMKILTFPVTILSLGLFLVVINAIMLKVAAAITPGFSIDGWLAAFIGAICLSVVSAILHWFVKDERQERN
ncbi:MAG TPA: phage holin family protein [Candidatus Angelobacter sp.]|nr:phage holin family protein [Candidatus Angelobacter sp.]